MEFLGLRLRTPIVQASGGSYTKDGKSIVKVARAGAAAITTKTIYSQGAKVGRPCTIRTSVGLMNCEEWSELDYDDWIDGEIAEAKKGNVPIIVAVSDKSQDFERIGRMALGAARAGADILEVSGGYGSILLPNVIKAVKKKVKDVPIMGKMSPLFHGVEEMGRSVEKAGADAISTIDTIGPCYLIDIETGKMMMGRGNGIGRLSGPAIKPIALYQVATLARTVKIPILGIGGVWTGNDVIEMMMAGATAVGICTVTLVKGLGVYREMENQIAQYMKRKNIKKIDEILGLALRDLENREQGNYEMFEARSPKIFAERCTGCMLCTRACGYEAITILKKTPRVQREKCYGCGLCISTCPTGALVSQYY